MNRDSIIGRGSDYLLALLPFMVVFILMPFSLYLANQEAFNYNVAILVPYLATALVLSAVVVLLLLLVNGKWHSKVIIFLFYLGAFLGLSDAVAPVQLGQLVSGRETPAEPAILTAAEALLAIAVIFCAVKLPWAKVRRFGAAFVVFLLVSEAFVVYSSLSPETRFDLGGNALSTAKGIDPPNPLADSGNVYHLVFDTFRTSCFQKALEQWKVDGRQLEGEFGGFTLFETNLTNYLYTTLSVSSFMTGTLYGTDIGLNEFRRKLKNSGIASAMHNAGYEVSMYALNGLWINEKASHFKTFEDTLSGSENIIAVSTQFADVWLLQVLPNFLQQEIYRKGEGMFSRWLLDKGEIAGQNVRVFASIKTMRQLIADETMRPPNGQYVFAHFYVPHPPYIMDRNCKYTGESTYEEQGMCTAVLIADFLSELKRLGRYDDATIILQSDHGNGYPGPIPAEIVKKIDSLSPPSAFRGKNLAERASALLLVKPPHAVGASLEISDRQTQLLDIPATIFALKDIPLQVTKGMSVFSQNFPRKRKIDVYTGFARKIKGQIRIIDKGEAVHLTYSTDLGWKLQPDITFWH